MSNLTNSTHGAGTAHAALEDDVLAVARHVGHREPVAVHVHGGVSNNALAEVHLDDGRILIVKQARFDWVAERFEAAKTVASLLRDRADVLAPSPLDIPRELGDRPLMAYWHVPLPTLREIWPADSAERTDLIRSLGTLIRRVHQIELPGHGPIVGPSARVDTLPEFLDADLRRRLGPAVAGVWPDAVDIVDRLIRAVPRIEDAGHAAAPPTLLHNDLHMGNILCKREPGGPRCVGLLDLDSAFAGPPASDLANAAVHHNPLFGQQARQEDFEELLLEGYGRSVDPGLSAFFEVYHLANMGFYSALAGDPVHAQQVAREAGAKVTQL